MPRKSGAWGIPVNDLRKSVATATTLAEVLREYGLVPESGYVGALKRRLALEGIDRSHIPQGMNWRKGKIDLKQPEPKERTCPRCRKIKSISEFPLKQKGRHGYTCKVCQRKYSKNWYEKNKKSVIEANHRTRARIKKWYSDFRSAQRCIKCGENHPACLQFHHKDPTSKIDSITNMLRYASLKRIKEELAKCICLCSNCHLKTHWEMKEGRTV